MTRVFTKVVRHDGEKSGDTFSITLGDATGGQETITFEPSIADDVAYLLKIYAAAAFKAQAGGVEAETVGGQSYRANAYALSSFSVSWAEGDGRAVIELETQMGAKYQFSLSQDAARQVGTIFLQGPKPT